MRMSTLVAATLVLTGTFLSGCATTGNFTPVIDAAHTFELGKLSFSAPSGEGWEYKRDSSPSAEFVQFLKKSAPKPKGFMVSVVQVRADKPVVSEKDLWDEVLHPFRKAVDAQKRFELPTPKCFSDKSFSKLGVLCSLEGTDFMRFATSPDEAVSIQGHAFAFVFPDDNRQVGVIEYLEGDLPGRLSSDTKKLVSEFAKSVTIRK